MSGLYKCNGWTNPTNLYFGPNIVSLSGYYSPAGSTTLVSISGANFFSYSTVSFGTFNPTVYFINSNNIQFYVPSTLNSGTYPVQVFNGSVGSNIVNYTIDNASGYWILNGNGSITNTNNSGTNSSLVSITSLSRGAPVTITNTSPYTVPSNVNWIICDSRAGVVTITLPSGLEYSGRELMFKNIGTNTVVSSASNIIAIDGSTTNSILPNIVGKWATIVSDGNVWITMQSN
jgi:hypothetical protein